MTDATAASRDSQAPPTESSVSTGEPAEVPAVEPSPPKQDSTRSGASTAVPIPQPKRKGSISAPVSKPNELISTPLQSTPPPQTTSIEPSSAPVAEPSAPKGLEDRTDTHTHTEEPQHLGHRDGSTLLSDPTPPVARPSRPLEPDATEIRPTKRRKTTPEAPVAAETDQSVSAQAVTPPATETEVPEVEATARTSHAPSSRGATDHGAKPKRHRKTRVKTEASESANGPQGTRKQRGRKQREPTPEGAENVEIAPTVVRMSDLCKDLRTGKMSKREMELRNMELADLERKKKAEEQGEDTGQTPIKQNGDAPSPALDHSEAQTQSGPVMRIVNGEIVLDNASLQVDRHADAERNAGVLEDVVENSLTRKINQSTYGKRTKAESWDEEMTDLFYRGLRMFGTDFMMISKLFPNRSRHQIKLKFNNEERRHPERIKETLLGPSETIDITTYSEMTNAEYDDPKAVQQELDEDKKRIEEQHAKDKEAQEELLRNPSGVDAADASTNAGPAADAPVKAKSRNNKKQTMKNMGGGTEEVVGSIDDFGYF